MLYRVGVALPRRPIRFCRPAALQVDELALVVRSVLIARRGSYAPADHPFMAKTLRALAPGEITWGVLDQLGGKALKARQIVAPEKK